MKVLIIGPAHPLRGGGMTTFNHRLAAQFIAEGHSCELISFSLQYPSFLFPGGSQYTTEAAPKGLVIHSIINSINPFNWLLVGRRLRRMKPDVVVVRYWLPLMGPALGTVLRRLRKNKRPKVICIADNIIPHEKRPGDKPFTRYFLSACDAFVVMSRQVLNDLKTFQPNAPAGLVPHPLYDNFGDPIPKSEARKKLAVPADEKLLLFFGFIRSYKGLHLLIEAMGDTRIRQQKITLLIAGEFYEDEKPYLQQIEKSGLAKQIILHSSFIADADVKYYFCAADAVVQPYKHATQSGVTPLAYHFNKPMVVTNVGGLPAMVPHLETGIVTEPDAAAIAEGILQFYALGEAWFANAIAEQKKALSWQKLTQTILQLAANVS